MNSLYSNFIKDSLSQEIPLNEYFVSDIVVGIRYTGVLLSNGILGLAYTLIDRVQTRKTQNL